VARLVLVSNRVPAPADRGVKSGGLVSALSEAMSGGLWFGWSGQVGEATETTAQVRRARGTIYATVDLSKQHYDRYYVGYANSTLWPLLHFRLGLMDFDRAQYDAYLEVNRAFAAALAPLIKPGDVVWVHDYHLIPLAGFLRALGVTNKIAFFLHVPFVPPSVFSVLPKGAELLASLCAYDLVGVQTVIDLRNLLDCVRELLGRPVDDVGRVQVNGHQARFGAFPIGIDSVGFARMAAQSAAGAEGKRLSESLGNRALVMGVDRLDYSKGLPNRFEGFSRMLGRWPEWRSKVTYIQIAARSRDDVPQYKTIRRELDQMAGGINGRFGAIDWVPLRYMNRPVPRGTLAGYYRLTRVGLVTPLRDGMNLVAKEYIAAQDPEDPGILVLSRFAGAMHELGEALLVNPYDPDEIAEALDTALRMPLDERRDRWRRMWDRIRADDAASWCKNFLTVLEA